ncbi:hypothetical protein B0T14DRAFT_416643 [Immersiella caudata]|uniref:Exoribonuclease phosphorolytic domain-containing protein n=1 Tax=Immersiella caudata TaxID=314043 RepID=A0AA39XEE0_9PEZI|nr:hypothetical protein B0T14DRAFT_416643 [Immersiella caudata]
MTTKREPEAALSVLPKSDGSARYSYAGYTVTASVNGPIEAQRRDEHAYEAHVDVIVRPAAGVGGTRERHLETILQASLIQLILVKNFPRSLIQIVLQVEASPENDYVNTKLMQASLNSAVIPALLQTAVLALLSAAIPMRATATSAIVAVMTQDGASRLVAHPSPREIEAAQSVHVLAFTSQDGLLLAESEGDFTVKEWDDVYDTAKKICCKSGATKGEGIEMVLDEQEDSGPDMRQFLRSALETKVAADLHWK